MEDGIQDYKFELKATCSKDSYKIFIEVFPTLKVYVNNYIRKPQPEKKLEVSKIELIADSPNLNEEGNLFINFIDK